LILLLMLQHSGMANTKIKYKYQHTCEVAAKRTWPNASGSTNCITDTSRYDFRCSTINIGKAVSTVAGLEWPRGFQEVKVRRFHDNGTGWW
jgi:hypothetical protein